MGPLLFFDPTCSEPYDAATGASRALGGTESTIARVAGALGARVMQHNRREASGAFLAPATLEGIAHVVVARDPRALPTAARLCPGARVHLWLHDQVRPGSTRGRRLRACVPLLERHAAGIVCVSDTLRASVAATLRGTAAEGRVALHTLYNPIADGLEPDGTPVDPDKLVFFASPNKGLHYALDAFRALRRALPGLRLVVGNPGYKTRAEPPLAGVSYLGPQPQSRMHAEVRSALCTFHPNFRIPETFGLVFAESHALGTPVLTHDCGAAREIVANEAELLPVTAAMRAYEGLARRLPLPWRGATARAAGLLGLYAPYIERLREWRGGARPRAAPDARFALESVTAGWRGLLA